MSDEIEIWDHTPHEMTLAGTMGLPPMPKPVKVTDEDYESLDAKENMVKDVVGEAVRADADKLRYDLIPPIPIRGLAEVLTAGSKKYADNNWMRGMKWSRCYASLMRHLQAWYSGEDLDPETGISHLHHAAANIMFLQQYSETFPEGDDRAFKEDK